MPQLPNNIDEVIRDLERGRNDEVYFAWRFLGITLHPGQIRGLRQSTGMVNLWVCGNRFGKTVMIGIRHIHRNFYKLGVPQTDAATFQDISYRTACLAPNGDILGVDFRTIEQILESRYPISREGEPIRTNKCAIGWYLIGKTESPKRKLLFKDNGSIEFYSTGDDKGTKLQGDFYGYGSYDEGGRSHHLYVELNQNIGQRLSQMGAPLDIPSTPAMDSPSLAYHHEIFQKGLRGEGGFTSFEGSAYENLFLPKHYFEREELRLDGDPLKDQVLYGKFVFSGNTVLNRDDIMACVTTDLNGGKRQTPGHKYVIGTDTASTSDEMVHSVLDVTGEGTEDSPWPLVRMKAAVGKTKSPDMHLNDFMDLFDSYNAEGKLHHNLECFSEGGIRFYMDLPRRYQLKTKHYAWGGPDGAKVKNTGTNNFKKADLIIALKKLITRRGIRIPEENKELIQQLLMYREEDTKLKQDRVMSLALAAWMALEGKPAQPTATAVAINW